MNLPQDWDFPPLSFQIMPSRNINKYNISNYGQDKSIDTYSPNFDMGNDYGYIVYKVSNTNSSSSNPNSIQPGVVVVVKLNKKYPPQDIKKVLSSSTIKKAAKQFLYNNKEKQALIPSVNSRTSKQLQKRFDPHTGERLQKRFDPHTGERLQKRFDSHTGERLQKRFDPKISYKLEPDEDYLNEAERITKENSIFNKELIKPKHWPVPNPMPKNKTRRATFSVGGKLHNKSKKRSIKKCKSKRNKSNRRKYKKRKTRQHNKSKY